MVKRLNEEAVMVRNTKKMPYPDDLWTGIVRRSVGETVKSSASINGTERRRQSRF